jgi:hypothetical protein
VIVAAERSTRALLHDLGDDGRRHTKTGFL